MIKKKLLSWLPIIISLVLLYLFFYFSLNRYVSFSTLKANQTWLLSWTTTHYVTAVLLFISIYTLTVAISVPGAVFLTLAGGFLFGTPLGTFLVVISATLGALILFYTVRISVGKWVSKSTTTWLERLRYGFEQNAFWYLLTLRLMPIFPFWVVNIIPALLEINPIIFVTATFIGILPGSFLFVSVGNNLNQFFMNNQTPELNFLFSPEIFLPLLGLAGLSCTPIIYKKWLKYRQQSKITKAIISDLAIIGGGAGGLSVAAVAARLGLKVILIESEKMGGDCLNYGCIPSKALLAAAKHAYHLKNSTLFGIKAKDVDIDFLKVLQHVKNVIRTIEKNDSVERFETLGVRIIQAKAHFLDPKTIAANNFLIQAKHTVIATGSSPFIPAIAGLELISYLTNETVFDLDIQPEHLIVIGGGAVGCELAQAFAMLGSKVTIITEHKLLDNNHDDCVTIIREQFISIGITLYENTQIKRLEPEKNHQITLLIEQQKEPFIITGSHLLIATGRHANTQELNLEKAGISYSTKGINVNAHLQTSNKKIYAIGDVIGQYSFTHMANYHASIVLRNIIFKIPSKVNYKAVPWVIFTDPEIAHVGMLEIDALKHKDLIISEWLFIDNDRAQTSYNTQGKIKIITDKKATVLGVTIVGSYASELILPWIIAVHEHKTLRSFTDIIVPYPTFSEISKRVAGEFYASKLFSNKTRKLISWLKKIG